MNPYRSRLADTVLKKELEAFGAVLIAGPKRCGKTTTASRAAGSIVRMHDPDGTNKILAGLKPSVLLEGKNPRLIDGWQAEPKLWDAVRLSVDMRGEPGLYILTGSVSADFDRIKHSGAGRTVRMKMGTMTLSESGDSTGEVSLGSLFEGKDVSGNSEISLEKAAEIVVRGGWPETIGKNASASQKFIRKYCENMLRTEAREVGGKRRSPERMASVMKSLSRHISSPLTKQTIADDVSSGNGPGISLNTLNDYIEALRSIYVLDEIPAWNPNLRSGTAVRTSPTVQLCDPAIAAYFLSASAEDLMRDPNTFGLLFESLVIRDLRVYARYHDGKVYKYKDKNGLEADAVIHLQNGKWGAAEVKLEHSWVDEGAKNLIKFAEKVDAEKMGGPAFLAVIVPSGYAYTREDGVHVIPITCFVK